MNKLPLQVFLPLDSKEKIDNFLNYLLTLKPKERYQLSDCITLFKLEKWKEYFWEKSRKYLIFSEEEFTITGFFPKKKRAESR